MASAGPNSGPPAPAPPSFRAHLKGVTSSNDDPDQCALCHGCIRYDGIEVRSALPCCGKRICPGCPKEVARRSVKACSCCGVVKNPSTKSVIGRLKKQAKMGAIWAQSCLGFYLCQIGTTYVDGLRWIEKAAAGGHPEACYYLGRVMMEGNHGIPLNYGRAREYVERAMTLDDAFANDCLQSLVELADLHDEEGESEASNAILLPLANSGFSLAQARFAVKIYDDENDPLAAYPLLKSAVLGAEHPHHISEAAYWAMDCSGDLERFAVVKRLLPMASKTLSSSIGNKPMEHKIERIDMMVVLKKKLCAFRKECATCGTALDRSNRKLCKGCRNHCYCSRECQKVHWNRKKDGHRDECKEAQELKVQIRDAGLMKKLAKN